MVSGPTDMKTKCCFLKKKKKAGMNFDLISLKENLRVLSKEKKLNMRFWLQLSFFK